MSSNIIYSCTYSYTCDVYSYACIPREQKSKSLNSCTSAHVDQIRAIYKCCGISRKGSHIFREIPQLCLLLHTYVCIVVYHPTTRTKVKICQSIRCTSAHVDQIRAIYKFCWYFQERFSSKFEATCTKHQSVVYECTFDFFLPECHFLYIIGSRVPHKIKAKCNNFLVKVPQMARVPQVENLCRLCIVQSNRFNQYAA